MDEVSFDEFDTALQEAEWVKETEAVSLLLAASIFSLAKKTELLRKVCAQLKIKPDSAEITRLQEYAKLQETSTGDKGLATAIKMQELRNRKSTILLQVGYTLFFRKIRKEIDVKHALDNPDLISLAAYNWLMKQKGFRKRGAPKKEAFGRNIHQKRHFVYTLLKSAADNYFPQYAEMNKSDFIKSVQNEDWWIEVFQDQYAEEYIRDLFNKMVEPDSIARSFTPTGRRR